MSTEADRVLAAWLCAECYGKYFIHGFKHGVVSENTVDFTRNTEIKLAFIDEDGGEYEVPVPLVKREYQKHSHYLHEFFDAHGIAWNGPVDTVDVSYWGHMAGKQSCWGDTVDDDDGSYSISNAYENSQIFFADLRNNILVMFHEVGSHAGSATGKGPIGQQLAYGGWYGGEGGCQTVNVFDAISMPYTETSNEVRKELITLGSYETFSTTSAGTKSFNVAASDRSGYSGGVGFYTWHWGTFSVIDQNKPFDCETGDYIELVEVDRLEDYRNRWDEFGSFTGMDAYDASVFEANFNGIGVNHIPDGIHDYPVFVEIDPGPKGSWAISTDDKQFYSQRNWNGTYFAKLDNDNPEVKVKEFKDDTTNTYTTYYPVAPV